VQRFVASTVTEQANGDGPFFYRYERLATS
jgi:hypothetical protein